MFLAVSGMYSELCQTFKMVCQGSQYVSKSSVNILSENVLHKKWSFSLGISSENVTKSAVSCRFGHIY